MNMAKHQRWLAGALCAALAACSSMDRNTSTASSDDASSANNMAGTASSPGSASGAMNSASTTGSDYQTNNPGGTRSAAANSYASTPATSGSSSATQTSYGTVQSIDSMQRQDVGAGAVGAAAVGGSMGAPTDRVYRVAVHLDDGTTQMVVVDNKPSYKTGDRVRYNNGTLEKY